MSQNQDDETKFLPPNAAQTARNNAWARLSDGNGKPTEPREAAEAKAGT